MHIIVSNIRMGARGQVRVQVFVLVQVDQRCESEEVWVKGVDYRGCSFSCLPSSVSVFGTVEIASASVDMSTSTSWNWVFFVRLLEC